MGDRRIRLVGLVRILATVMTICDDSTCPCQDGDPCHYKDLPGSPAMKTHVSSEFWRVFWRRIAPMTLLLYLVMFLLVKWLLS